MKSLKGTFGFSVGSSLGAAAVCVGLACGAAADGDVVDAAGFDDGALEHAAAHSELGSASQAIKGGVSAVSSTLRPLPGLDVTLPRPPAPAPAPPLVLPPPVCGETCLALALALRPPIQNGGFEAGEEGWNVFFDATIPQPPTFFHSGTTSVRLSQEDGSSSQTVAGASQRVVIPASSELADLTFWLRVEPRDRAATAAFDRLRVELLSPDGQTEVLAEYSNLDDTVGHFELQGPFDLRRHRGESVVIGFYLFIQTPHRTSRFYVDDVEIARKASERDEP